MNKLLKTEFKFHVCLITVALLSLVAMPSFAAKRTVDADGGSAYTSILAAATGISSGDTIYIQGSDLDIYTESDWDIEPAANITIMSRWSDPDSFPVLTLSGPSWTFWWNNKEGTTRFEAVTLDNCASISLAHSNRNLIIDRCIVRNFSSTVFERLTSDHSSAEYLRITNSIFQGNDTIFSDIQNANPNPSPFGSVYNCTFIGNTVVNNDLTDETSVTNNRIVDFTNCIFKDNVSIYVDSDVKSAYTNCLVPAQESGWGAGCVYSDDPGFVKYPSDNASDLCIQSNSPAINSGSGDAAPSIDIRGNFRQGAPDMGAFEFTPPSVLYIWDVNNGSGIQPGNGTWGTDNFWTTNGTSLSEWTAGNSALFSGSNGTYSITVNGSQIVDSISFESSGYSLTNGTLALTGRKIINVAAGKTADINSSISASSYTKDGSGTLTVSPLYSGGPVTIRNGTLAIGGPDQNDKFSGDIFIINSASLKLTSDNRLNNNVSVDIGSGAAFDMNGRYDDIGFISGAGSVINTSGEGLTLDLANGESRTFSGSISGSGSFNIRGENSTSVAGRLIFSGVSSSTGGTYIASKSDGIKNNAKAELQLTGGNNRLPAGSVLTFGSSGASGLYGKLILGGSSGASNQTVAGITSASGTGTFSIVGGNPTVSTLTVNNNTNYHFYGNIGGDLLNENYIALVKSGNDTLSLTGIFTYNGPTTINGPLELAGPLYNNGTSPGAIVINEGGALILNSNNFLGNHSSFPAVTISINRGGSMVSNGRFNTLGKLTLNGGELISNGGLSANWTTWSLHDTVTVNGTSVSRIITAGGNNNAVKVGNNLNGGMVVFNVLDNASGDDLMIESRLEDDRDTVSDVWTPVSSGIVKDGAGTMLLSASNTYSGATLIKAGTLRVGSADALGATTSGTTVENNATLSLEGDITFAAEPLVLNGTGVGGQGAMLFESGNAGSAVWTGPIQLASTSTILIKGTEDTLTVTGLISGSGGLIKADDGRLILTANNSYSGVTTISAGVLQLGKNGTSGSIQGDVTNNGSIIFSRSDSSTFSGVISGSGSLIKQDSSGTVVLSAANTYTGITTIGNGVLRITNGSALGSPSKGVEIQGYGRLELSGDITVTGETAIFSNDNSGNNCGSLQSESGDNTWAGPILLSCDEARIGAQAGSLTISGNISDSSSTISLVVNSSSEGAVILNGKNTYGGATRVYGGTLKISGDDRLPVTASLALGFDKTDGVFDLNGYDQTVSGLTLNDSTRTNCKVLNNGTSASVLTVDNSSDYIYNGTISDGSESLGLKKKGSGKLTLSGLSNSYSGATLVEAGTLDITGAVSSSAIEIKAGGTLSGTGLVAAVTVVGGTVSPGNGNSGTLTCSSLSFDSESKIKMDLGTSGDVVKINGNLTIDGTLEGSALSGFTAGNYTLFEYTGTLTDSGMEIGTMPGGFAYSITTGDGKVLLSVTPLQNYTWDVSSEEGINAGNGKWGIDNFWTKDGITLEPWPQKNSTATFAGSDGDWAINISGIQKVDSLTFLNSGYVLSEGTIDFGNDNSIFIAAKKHVTIYSVISGTAGLKLYSGTGGDSRIFLEGQNTYTGPTIIGIGVEITTSYLADGGVKSGIGRSNSSAENLILDGGCLRYTGEAASTDRILTITTHGGCLYSSGSGPLTFTNKGAVAITGTGNTIFELGGKYEGSNIFWPQIGDGPDGVTVVRKNGLTSTWVFTGENTYSGGTTITGGTLQIGNNGVNGSVTGGIENNAFLSFKRSDRYTFDGIISGTGEVRQEGSGTLVLTGENTWTGSTSVRKGSLIITGSTSPENEFTIDSGAIIGGSGTIAGRINVGNYGSISPGVDEPGKLVADTIVLNSKSKLKFDLGARSDSIVCKDLTLDGKLDIIAGSGFKSGTYNIIKCNGKITNNSLEPGEIPQGFACAITLEDNTVKVTVSLDASTIISDFSAVPLSGFSPLRVNFQDLSKGQISSYFWDFGDGTTSTQKNPQHSYSSFGSFDVTLKVEGPAGIDSLVKEKFITTFDKRNNPVTISANYLSGTSVQISMNNLDEIDTSTSPRPCSLGIWIENDSLPSYHGTSFLLTTYGFDELLRSASFIDTLILPAGKNSFGLMTGLFWNNDSISSFQPINGCIAVLKNTHIPDNPIFLKAKEGGPGKIKLSWNRLADTTISVVRILMSKTEIPAGRPAVYGYDSFLFSINDSAVVIDKLEHDTYYYFAAQVNRNNYWSPISEDAIAEAKTPAATDTVPVANTIDLQKILYDSLSHSIKVSWCLDRTVADDLELGITFAFKPDSGFKSPQVITVDKSCDSAVLNLRGAILFDTTYYVSLWLRKPYGVWSGTTDSSRGSIRTPEQADKVITFFGSSDTVNVFNGSVLLWKGASFPAAEARTTNVYISSSGKKYEGMVPVGSRFRFGNKEPFPSFYLGMIYAPLPSGYSPADVRLYRETDTGLEVEYGCVVDSLNGIIFTKVSNMTHPFLMMIDTLFPSVAVESDTGSVCNAGVSVLDTFKISDNISNLSWKYVYGKGEEAPLNNLSGLLDGKSGTVDMLVSPELVSSRSGLRALMIVSDGVHTDTVNISRRVRREISDPCTTRSVEWYPLSVTATLEKPQPEFLIDNLSEYDSSFYDPRFMRIYKWVGGDQKNEWLEYSEQVKPEFVFSPGNLYWVKTLRNIPIDFGSGTTVSLKAPYEIELAPGEWTDFSLPFSFNIRAADIIGSTTGSENLQFYYWAKDTVSRRYYSKELYVRGLKNYENLNVPLQYSSGNAFTVYNSGKNMVKMRIPPVPLAMSPLRPLAKQNASRSWSVKILSKGTDGASLPDIYCGVNPEGKATFFPASPSFLQERVFIYRREKDSRYGHFMSEDFDGVLKQEIAFVNNGPKPVKIGFELEEDGLFPEQISAMLLEPESGMWQSRGTVTLAPGSVEYRWLAASDELFRQDFSQKAMTYRYSIKSVYPNPFSSTVFIKFAVPLNANGSLQFTVHDALGRLVWKKKLNGNLSFGNQLLSWDGKDTRKRKINAGIYFLTMSVIDQNGKLQKRFNSRITYLP